MSLDSKAFEQLGRELPALVFRSVVGKLVPGLNSRYLANLDCRGEGPSGRITIGRKVAYPRDAFIKWLIDRSENY